MPGNQNRGTLRRATFLMCVACTASLVLIGPEACFKHRVPPRQVLPGIWVLLPMVKGLDHFAHEVATSSGRMPRDDFPILFQVALVTVRQEALTDQNLISQHLAATGLAVPMRVIHLVDDIQPAPNFAWLHATENRNQTVEVLHSSIACTKSMRHVLVLLVGD